MSEENFELAIWPADELISANLLPTAFEDIPDSAVVTVGHAPGGCQVERATAETAMAGYATGVAFRAAKKGSPVWVVATGTVNRPIGFYVVARP